MARKLRVEYPGAIYHVMNRGDHRELIFKAEFDRQRFLETLGRACEKTDWQVHAYCLMPNHFHLVIETPQPNLVAGMKWLLGTYTGWFNRRHRLSGHLFSGRYKALPVDGSGNGYLRTVCDYVHLNPARARLIQPEAPLRTFRWSSFGEYLDPAGQRVRWLRVERMFGECGIARDTPAGRRQFERRTEQCRQMQKQRDWQPLRQSWFLGDEEFRRELLEQMSSKLGAHHFGPERQASAASQAEAVIAVVLKRSKLTEQDLERMLKADPWKLSLARRLRQETTVTLKWIAERLHMGTWTYLNNRLYWDRRNAVKLHSPRA